MEKNPLAPRILAMVLAGAILGCYAGTAAMLSWPLSVQNTLAALLCGLVAAAVLALPAYLLARRSRLPARWTGALAAISAFALTCPALALLLRSWLSSL